MANKPFPWHRAVGGIMIHLHCFLLKKIPSAPPSHCRTKVKVTSKAVASELFPPQRSHSWHRGFGFTQTGPHQHQHGMVQGTLPPNRVKRGVFPSGIQD